MQDSCDCVGRLGGHGWCFLAAGLAAGANWGHSTFARRGVCSLSLRTLGAVEVGEYGAIGRVAMAVRRSEDRGAPDVEVSDGRLVGRHRNQSRNEFCRRKEVRVTGPKEKEHANRHDGTRPQ